MGQRQRILNPEELKKYRPNEVEKIGDSYYLKPGTPNRGGTKTVDVATLYGPNGSKRVVETGSQTARDLQKQGWGLTAGGYKAPAGKQATLYGPGGQREVVDVGSDRARTLQSEGWGLTEGSYEAPGGTPGGAPGEAPGGAPAEGGDVIGGPAAVTTTTGYQGKGGQYGELPKRDKAGRYRWINADGSVTEQPGFSLEAGETGWEYLGEHSPEEYISAEALFKTQPPPKQFSTMTDLEKKEYLDQAHKEISQGFLTAVAQGQSDLIYELGSALGAYKDTMEAEDFALDQDVKNTIDAMEASGLTFTGKAREQLGDLYSAVGRLTAEDRAKIISNIETIDKIRKGEIAPGQAEQLPGAPKPVGIDAELNPATGQPWTEPEKEQAWQQMFQTPEWNDYVKNVTTRLGAPTDTAAAGGGVYGLGEQLDRLAGTRAFEGNVLRRNRLIQEGSRRLFNQNIRSLGVQAERGLGTANLIGMQGPTIGGQQIFTPGQGVLGTAQAGAATDIYRRAGDISGQQANQWSYTFPL